jgi:LacI family transcriptional regulator
LATINDVARLARVSSATVSRALRKSVAVAEPTRTRVLEAAAELHYHPNQMASTLASSRSSTIGLLVPGIENPFYYDMYSAISRLVQRRGYELLLKTTSFDNARLIEALHQMIEITAAGVIVLGAAMPEALVARLKDRGILMAAAPEIELSTACECLLQYLADLGHRRLGFVQHQTPFAEDRIFVLGSMLQRFPQLRITMASGADTLDGGRLACRKLLTQTPDITALVCSHDIMAVGALRELHDRSYRVPDDISIAGVDNIALARFCAPALTTIDVPRGRIASALCSYLFGKPAAASVDCALIVRRSTAAART